MPLPATRIKSHHVGYPEDKDPILLMAPTRKSVALFGAVNLRDGKLVTHFEKKFNAMTFKRLSYHFTPAPARPRKIVLLLDNARYHHALALRPFLKNHRDRLASLFACLQSRIEPN